MTFVIVVSGASGSGKSTLAQALADRFPHAATFHFDDYKSISTYPDDLHEWIASGGNPNLWETPQFCQDLRTLRQGQSIVLPNNLERVEPAPVIVVEEPFGRERNEMADFVDFVILIVVPLELALARKLLEYIDYLEEHPETQPLPSLRDYLMNYPTYREVYRTVLQRVERNCDLQVDGTQPVEQIVNVVLAALRRQVDLTLLEPSS